MKCPRCLTDLYCPCSNCAERSKGKPVWKFTDGDEPLLCGSCGLVFSDPYQFDGPPEKIDKAIAVWRSNAKKKYGKEYLKSVQSTSC